MKQTYLREKFFYGWLYVNLSIVNSFHVEKIACYNVVTGQEHEIDSYNDM